MTVTISSLHCYPLKSARGLDLPEAQLTPAGISHDRRWMLVNGSGRFLTQRELPLMALIRPNFSSHELILAAPSVADLHVPLQQQFNHSVAVQVWKDECPAFDEGEAAAQWLQAVLGRECRLVRFDPRHRRLSSRDWTGKIEAENQFSDGFPLLIISRASLAELNSRMSRPLSMNRFRPNIVIDGVGPYDEDRIDELFCDGLRLKVVKPCTRCRITTTDQESGQLDGEEPLRTLKSYRYDAQLRGVLFGQNTVIVEGTRAVLRCGQTLQVTWKPAAAAASG